MLLGERHAGQLQHLLGLLEGQRQRRLADLGQLVAQPQPPEPQRRVGARGDHDPQGGRRAVQELVEVAVDRLGDLVEVVEHEHDGLVAPVQCRDQRRRQAVDAALRVGGERRHGLAGARAVERLEDRAPEPPAVGVGGVEREPGDRPRRPAGRDPAPQQHGLARTGRRRDQRQGALRPLVERFVQPSTHHRRRLFRRQRELRGRQCAGASDGGVSRRSSSPKGMDGVTELTLSHPAGVRAAHPAARHDRRPSDS